MINYIKQAVESVEGIKSFLFNTDYRNNFNLQNVEFPCCVLTPIMRTNYDLNNIIRESAELQLSVVDLAPYEYTGDDLYEINKRCSDLALQVIANLQVKSKLEKELTFEFILPSGDELISGVMCNLTATMKQGSCIGKPSYVEVIVQPIKRESITSNGKHVIAPSSGFTAMKEVEVDVNIDIPTIEEKSVDITRNGEVEILPTSADAMTKVTANVQVPPPPLEEKQVTITKAKTTEIITPDAEYGLNRVEVSTDIPLESKQITITENGTTTIEASEGFEGIESVEITTDVDTLQGLDFEGVFDEEQADEINQFYKDGVEYAKYIKENWSDDVLKSLGGDARLVYMPEVEYPAYWVKNYFFEECANLQAVDGNIIKFANVYAPFSKCTSLKRVPIIDFALYTSQALEFMRFCTSLENVVFINTYNTTNLTNIFYFCISLKTIKYEDASKVIAFTRAFSGCYLLENLFLAKWGKANISIADSKKITPESIHYIIQNAMNVADGATARTLTLSAIAKTNWQNSEYYAEDLAVLSTKGITIA